MSLDFEDSSIDKAALLVMHYQVDVFAILFGEQPSPLLDNCNALIRRWRGTGRPIFFPTFFSGRELRTCLDGQPSDLIDRTDGKIP
ncbi:MAG TPA: hypothetical protein VJT10_23725 [Steroidobacteraceae bacterium]|nr:hypothetical protein [Steroidobacteraceae bacterium]